MLTIARVVFGLAIAVFATGTANAATIDIPLDLPGSSWSHTGPVAAAGPFMEDYTLHVGGNYNVTATFADASASLCPGCGIAGLTFALTSSGPPPFALSFIGAGPVTFSMMLLAGDYDFLVSGNRSDAGGGYAFTFTADGDPAGDPAHMPIPAGAFLLASGLAVLYGASRKKTGSELATTHAQMNA